MRGFPPPSSPRPMLASSASQPPEATEQLIEGCLKGDQHAWNLIVARYRRKVFNVAYKFVGRHDLAEDLTQDVFLKIFKALGTFDQRANFQTWLISVSRNLCIDHYRSVRKEREMVDRSVDAADVSPVSTEPDALATLVRDDRRAMLHRALARIRAQSRRRQHSREGDLYALRHLPQRTHHARGRLQRRPAVPQPGAREPPGPQHGAV